MFTRDGTTRLYLSVTSIKIYDGEKQTKVVSIIMTCYRKTSHLRKKLVDRVPCGEDKPCRVSLKKLSTKPTCEFGTYQRRAAASSIIKKPLSMDIPVYHS